MLQEPPLVLPDMPGTFDPLPPWVTEGLGELSNWERQQIGVTFRNADEALRQAIVSLAGLLGRLHREEPTRPVMWTASAVSKAAEGYAAVDRLLTMRDGVIHRHALERKAGE